MANKWKCVYGVPLVIFPGIPDRYWDDADDEGVRKVIKDSEEEEEDKDDEEHEKEEYSINNCKSFVSELLH